MRRTTIATVCGVLALLLVCSWSAAFAQDATRAITDSAGRRVEIPQRISRVVAAGPPASILLYTLAPEKMVGWVLAPSPAEKEFLLHSVRDLPEYGRLTGRGGTANLESVLKFKPDLIIDAGSVGATFVSLANNVQEQTKIPCVLLDGTFGKTPEIYRLLGEVLGVSARAEQLAAMPTRRSMGSPRGSLPLRRASARAYSAGAATAWKPSCGLHQPGGSGSGGRDQRGGCGWHRRAQQGVDRAGPVWNPDIILALDPGFHRAVATDPLWNSLQAVRNGRIYLAPNLPYGWFDAPPGVNRLIGVRWLASILSQAVS